jgi:acyl carrier protein
MQTSVRNAVISSLAQLTGCIAAEISDNDDLVDDLGVDSFISVNLLMEVEDRLKARLPDGCEGSFVAVRTVGELVEKFETAFAQVWTTSEVFRKAEAGGREHVAKVARSAAE